MSVTKVPSNRTYKISEGDTSVSIPAGNYSTKATAKVVLKDSTNKTITINEGSSTISAIEPLSSVDAIGPTIAENWFRKTISGTAPGEFLDIVSVTDGLLALDTKFDLYKTTNSGETWSKQTELVPTSIAAAPTVIGTRTDSSPASISVPTGSQVGDLLIINISTDLSSITTTEPGWVWLHQNSTGSVGYKFLEQGFNSNITFTGVDTLSAATAYSIRNAGGIGNVATGGSTGLSIVLPTVTVVNNSLLVVAGRFDDDLVTISAYPAGFSNGLASYASGGTAENTSSSFLASKYYATAETVSPGEFTLTGTDGDAYGATSIVVLPKYGIDPVGSSATDFSYVNNRYFISATNSTIAISTNLSSWAVADLDATQSIRINGVAFGASAYVAAGSGASIFRSTDGINWTSQTNPFGSTDVIREVKYLNNLFFLVGNSGKIATSSNGTTWTLSTVPTLSTVSDVLYDDIYYSVDYSGNIFYSTTGNSWDNLVNNQKTASDASTGLVWSRLYTDFGTVSPELDLYIDTSVSNGDLLFLYSPEPTFTDISNLGTGWIQINSGNVNSQLFYKNIDESYIGEEIPITAGDAAFAFILRGFQDVSIKTKTNFVLGSAAAGTITPQNLYNNTSNGFSILLLKVNDAGVSLLAPATYTKYAQKNDTGNDDAYALFYKTVSTLGDVQPGSITKDSAAGADAIHILINFESSSVAATQGKNVIFSKNNSIYAVGPNGTIYYQTAIDTNNVDFITKDDFLIETDTNGLSYTFSDAHQISDSIIATTTDGKAYKVTFNTSKALLEKVV